LTGYPSDTIASALHANGIQTFSKSIRYQRDRGFFCGIGKCSSCLMQVEGVPNVRTCIAPLLAGITVESQHTPAAWPSKFNDHAQDKQTITIDVLVVGAGPAGLEASLQAAQQGASVLLVDENQQVGGQLVKQTHKFFGSKQEKAGTRGINIAKDLEKAIEEIESQPKILKILNATVFGFYENIATDRFTFAVMRRNRYQNQLIEVHCKAVVIAVGAMENMLLFPGNDLPGVYGAGAVQTLMNVYGVKPGKSVLMVGAGNVGLIVSYQLLQAGIDVACVVEAAPVIGGYHVHAAKLRRCGVPILTSHSIKEVHGDHAVKSAEIIKLDKNWKMIDGSEQIIDCDTVCLAVGLTPSTRLLGQIGVEMATIPEAGGYVAIHDESMQTTVDHVYVAGDASGIEEASTAMIEGKIAGLHAANHIGYRTDDAHQKKQQFIKEIARLRAGPFGDKPRIAKQKMQNAWGEYQ
jgi:sarcosine oxidase, subunit alpha